MALIKNTIQQKKLRPLFAVLEFVSVPYLCLFRYKGKWMLKISNKCSIFSNAKIRIAENEIDSSFKVKIAKRSVVAIKISDLQNNSDALHLV